MGTEVVSYPYLLGFLLDADQRARADMCLILIVAHTSQALFAFRKAHGVPLLTLLAVDGQRPFEELLAAEVAGDTHWGWHRERQSVVMRFGEAGWLVGWGWTLCWDAG
jgi:hypothetical protein